MRKLLSFLLIFNLAHATAPTGYKNETATAKTYAQDLVFPNNQLTKQAGLDSRIETGNTNLLTNPSFEHSTVTTGWTITNATATADTANQVEGKKALSLSLIGALDVYQDSTVNAANLVGLQGNVSIKIKTSDVDGLKVCARNAGVTSTSLCINIPKDGVWKEINIPNILTATSNGIAITSTGTTGTVKLDDAFVGTSAPFQGVNGAKLVGTLKYVAATNCQWSSSSGSFADFSADTDCPTPTVTGSLSARTTKIPGFTISNAPAGVYRILANGFISRQVNNGECSYRFNDGTNSSQTGIVGGVATGNFIPMFEGQIELSTNQSTWNVSLQSLSIGATNGCYIETDTAGEDLTFSVYYFPPESKIYSDFNSGFAENAGEIFATAQTSCPTGTLPADGSAVSRTTYAELFKNIGTTYGVGDGSTTFNVPNAKGVFIRGAGSQTISSITYTGTQGTTQGDQMQGHKHDSPVYSTAQPFGSGVTNVTAGVAPTGNSSSSTSVTTSDGTNGTPRTGTETRPANISALYCIRAYNKNIVGSFAGIERCENAYECTAEFSAQVSGASVITNQNIPWLASSSGTTGAYTLTYNTNLKDGTSSLSSPMNCECTSGDGSTRGCTVSSSTTTGILVSTQVNGSTAASSFHISCQKGTNDYKPKTAKVASSIGVPTVPGITTTGTGNLIDTFSVSYGTTNATTVCSASPCSYLDQIGTAVSSITRSGTGSYAMNTSKTYSKLKCTIGTSNPSAYMFTSSGYLSCSNCSSVTWNTVNTGATALDSFGTLVCQGSY